MTERELARVRWRRWLPTAVIQAAQRAVQRRLLGPVLQGQGAGAALGPLRYVARLGFVRRLPARLVGVGVLPEHVRTPALGARGSPTPDRSGWSAPVA